MFYKKALFDGSVYLSREGSDSQHASPEHLNPPVTLVEGRVQGIKPTQVHLGGVSDLTKEAACNA